MEEFNRHVEAAMREFRDRTAFVEGVTSMTFSDMEAAVRCAEAWLKAQGLGRGDRIAALTTNRIETVALEWATYRIGGIWIGVPVRERDLGNLQRVLDDFTPGMLVVESSAVDLWRDDSLLQLSGEYREEAKPPAIFDPVRYRAWIRTSTTPEIGFQIDSREGVRIPIVRIRYTSGASGEPKAIAYSAGTSMAILDQITKLLEEEPLTEFSAGEDLTMVQGLPIVWATGSLIAPVFCRGGKNLLLPRWDLKEFVHAVAAEQHVLAFLTPGLLARLAAYSETSGAGWAEAPKRFQILVAGSPLPVSTMRRVSKALPERVEYYLTLGQTEASFPITWHRVEEADFRQKERPFVPLGRIAPPYETSKPDPKTYELKLVGKAVAPARWVRRNSAPGRWEPLEQPHATGDLVASDQGVLHYLGRKGVVPLPGKLPAPEAVEAVVDECPGVDRSRLDYCDQGARSVLTIKPHGTGVSLKAVDTFFRAGQDEANLPDFEVDEIRFGDVPLTMTGKVSRERSVEGGGLQV